MIRLMPWAVGGGELVAGRSTRGRVLAMGRLTAPTHSPWFWLTLWISVAAAGLISQIPALSDSGGAGPAQQGVPHPSGVAFAPPGPLPRGRRPRNPGRPDPSGAGLRVPP